MNRGEIYFADLSPVIGSEADKRRPVLIVSNDANNRASATVTVIPITSTTTRVFPFEVFLPAKQSGLPRPSKAQAQQVRTISKARLDNSPVGALSEVLMSAIAEALRLHLAL